MGGGGGWGNNNLFPLKDAATTNTVVSLALSGTKTLRFDSNGGDWDFMLFAPATALPPQFSGITVDASGNVTITWTGGGTLQVTTSLTAPVTWTSVTGATSPYTVTAAQLPGKTVFARINSNLPEWLIHGDRGSPRSPFQARRDRRRTVSDLASRWGERRSVYGHAQAGASRAVDGYQRLVSASPHQTKPPAVGFAGKLGLILFQKRRRPALSQNSSLNNVRVTMRVSVLVRHALC